MSTTNSTQSQSTKAEEIEEKVSKEYRVTEGVEPSEASVGGDDHPITNVLGDQDHYEFQYDPRATGKSIAERYDEPAAALREYIHNAETACIRRVREELVDLGYSRDDVIDMTLDQAKEIAFEEAGYSPTIEITHHWPGSERPALVIEDNGIGISIEEFVVMRKHAHSASFLDGSVGGQFGQGIYSAFMIIGPNGEGKFDTKSRIDDESYAMRMRITGFNPLSGGRDRYGTRFTFPALSTEGKDVDIGSKVEEYCQGIRIPVMYQEFDQDGTHIYDDEFIPSQLEDDYEEDVPLVTYENKYFRSVASPACTSGNRTPKTLLTSMPIERNDSRYGSTANDKFESPWKFDIRLNYEDGRIAFGPNEGLVPVDDKTYESMDEERKEHYIARSDMSSGDIEMPKPVDDRDRLRDGHRDFFKQVSLGLQRQFANKFAEILTRVNSMEDVAELSGREKTLFLRGNSHFVPNVSKSSTNRQESIQTIQETLQDETGVTVNRGLAEKMIFIQSKVTIVPRGTSNPTNKGGRRHRNREDKKVWRVLVDTAGDSDVYMFKSTSSEKKIRLAWELDEDNYVVQVEDTGEYSKFEDLFGWKQLKELPSRNLGEKFPVLSDEFLDKWDTTSSSTSRSGQGRGSYDRDRAKKRDIKIRSGRGKDKFKTHKAVDVYEKLQSGGSVKRNSQFRSRYAKQLVVVDQNEHHATSYTHLAKNEVGVTVVPSYVKEYLLELDNAYEPEEIQREHIEHEIEFDWTSDQHRTSATLEQMMTTDVLLVVLDKYKGMFEDNLDEVREIVSRKKMNDNMTSLTIVSGSEFNDCWMAFGTGKWETDVRVYYTSKKEIPNGLRGYRKSLGYNDRDLFLEYELPSDEYDRDSPEWERLFGNRTEISTTTRHCVQMIKDLDECDSVDHPFPSQR